MRHHKAISAFVALRFIFPILVAFAMLFAPFAMQSGGAMAATGDHHGQATASSHCGDQSSDGKLDKAAGKPCCAAMCAAVAVAPGAPIERLSFARAAYRQVRSQIGPGFLAKLPVPPPRPA